MYVCILIFFLLSADLIINPTTTLCFLILEHSFQLLSLMQTEGKPQEESWVNWKGYFSCWQVEIVLFRVCVSGFFWDSQLQVGLHHVVTELSGLMYNWSQFYSAFLGLFGGLLPAWLKFSSIWSQVLEGLGVLKQIPSCMRLPWDQGFVLLPVSFSISVTFLLNLLQGW